MEAGGITGRGRSTGERGNQGIEEG